MLIDFDRYTYFGHMGIPGDLHTPVPHLVLSDHLAWSGQTAWDTSGVKEQVFKCRR